MLNRIIRKMLRIPPPAVGRAQALEIALKVCEQNEWEIKKPRVIKGIRVWTIWIDRNSKNSPMIEISRQSGEILKLGTSPR